MAERSKRAGLSTQTAAICLEQRSRWQAGERITAEEYVRQFPVLAIQPELLLDVIYNEFLLRELHGPPPSEEEFCRRFPECQADLARLLEVHRAIESPGLLTPREQSGEVAPTSHPADLADPDAASRGAPPFPADCENLASVFARGFLSPRQAARLVAQVCVAAQRARLSGAELMNWHPQTIVIDSAGEVRLIADTLAKDDGATAGGSRAGDGCLAVEMYRSPEQVQRLIDATAHSAEVFVAGILLYQALTGRPPFYSVTAGGVDAKILHEHPLPPRSVQASVPRELDRICMRCLAKQAVERYADVLDLAGDLQSFLAGLPPVNCRKARAPRIRRWWRRLTGG